MDQHGLEHRAEGKLTSIGPASGIFAFYAGPQLHIVDTYALGDALLARLPAQDTADFYIGHFVREVPAGYWDNPNKHGNQIKDPALAEFYEKLLVVTHGSLFAEGRLLEIWRLNTGYYHDLIDTYLTGLSENN